MGVRVPVSAACRRVAAALTVLLVLLLTAAPQGAAAGPACVGCADTKFASCPTCAGKGRTTEKCDACDGRGKPLCPLHRRGKETSVDCPNPHCRAGDVKWADGWRSRCKLCGGSRIPCRVCSSTPPPCAECRGGTAAPPCTDCVGTGKLPCRLCAPADAKCGTCGGETSLPCPACEGRGLAPRRCEHCSGRGVTLCAACRGSSRLPCARCVAGGKERTTRTDEKSCSECSGRGFQTCDKCTRGTEQCYWCERSGALQRPCRGCDETKRADCRTCGGWEHRSLELQAASLAKRGSHAEAGRILERAAEVCARRLDGSRRELEGAKASRDAAVAAAKAAGQMGKTDGSPWSPEAKARIEPLEENVQSAESWVREYTESSARVAKALAELRPKAPAPPK